MTDDDPLARLEAEETLAPPVRRAVPAVDLPPLEPGTLVTVGSVEGRWWLVDELMVGKEPGFFSDDREAYGCIPWSEWASAEVRAASGQQSAYQQQLYRPNRLWVYVDDADSPPRTVADLPSRGPDDWFERTGDGTAPPAVLYPRPARELPSLCGRRVRTRAVKGERAGQWEWAVCVSEPIATAAVSVRVVQLVNYGRLMYGCMPDSDPPGTMPLHRLWTY